MTTTDTLEAVCARLAGRLCPECGPSFDGAPEGWLVNPDRSQPLLYMHEACHGTGLDSRFEVLRGEHEIAYSTRGEQFCSRCPDGNPLASFSPYCLRTDLGALADVMAACGWYVVFLGAGLSPEWACRLRQWETAAEVERDGETKGLAFALALEAAVGE